MKCLQDLHATNPEHDMRRIEHSKDSLLKDCYAWILQDPHLQEWQRGDTYPLLWINGDPGKGKTMLMIALVRELSKSLPGKSNAVTFFFCQSTDPRLNNAASILRGLISKLLMEQHQLANAFRSKYESEKHLFNGPNAIYALFSILSEMLDNCPGTFLIIDALDECNSGIERDQLLDLITKHAKSSKVKWLLSSRNYPEIKRLLELESRMLSLELNEEHISHAVQVFIEQKTSELAAKQKYSQDLRDEVKKELKAKANSTFLWVALVCKSLLAVTKWETLSTLQKLPPGLQPLYARMMKQICHTGGEEVRNLCFRILRSASLAFRPLSMGELIIMAELPPELQDDNTLDDLIDRCGSFIIVRQESVYFVHQSAKDYLVAEGAQELFPAEIQEEHGRVTRRSLVAMSKTLETDMCKLRHPGSPARTATINNRLRAINYACCFWVDHLALYLKDSAVIDYRYQGFLSDNGDIDQFLLKFLLNWIEALNLFGQIQTGILALQCLKGNIDVSKSNILH